MQARNIQQCMHEHNKCREKEVLKKELHGKGIEGATGRLIINNEYVQGLDKSDGSKPYDIDISTNEIDYI